MATSGKQYKPLKFKSQRNKEREACWRESGGMLMKVDGTKFLTRRSKRREERGSVMVVQLWAMYTDGWKKDSGESRKHSNAAYRGD